MFWMVLITSVIFERVRLVRKSVLGCPWASAMAVAPPMEEVEGPVIMAVGVVVR
jgi:hypothetical protein